jgi:antitoxin ParD1/3/4
MAAQWGDSKAATANQGHYAATSDYVRDLIRRNQDNRTGVTALQAMIDEGLASATSPRSLDEILAEARGQAEKYEQG